MAEKDKLAMYGGDPVRNRAWSTGTTIGQEEINEVTEVMRTGNISCFRGGKKVKEFEKRFSEHIQTEYGVATTSGTTALHTALSALDIQREDEVMVPAFTFVSTASVVLQEGGIPIFADIDPKTFCISPEDVENKITPKTKAIIPVHIFGHPAEMGEIMDLSEEYGIYVIEDCAQAHGATYEGNKVGSIGHMGCFSFFQTKNMTTGEGGMITTNEKELYRRLRLKREHGSPENEETWYIYDELGFNYNMTEIQAAIGSVQLSKLDRMNQKRRENAHFYSDKLSDTGLILPEENGDIEHVYHIFTMLLPEEYSDRRDWFVEAVRSENVPIDTCYPDVLYNAKLFRDRGYEGNCPVSENVSKRVINIYTDPSIDEELREDMADAVIKVSRYLFG